jgi:hypothetical protein
LSPKTRRGRAAAGSHRKTAPRGAPTRKPVADIEALEEEDFDEFEEPVVKPKRRKKRPVRTESGLARVLHAPARVLRALAQLPQTLAGIPRSSAYKYLSEAVGVYIPLFLAFCVLFAGVWAWISFGPHTNTPKENWVQIEKKWIQPREDARQRITEEVSNFKAQQAAYKAFRDATESWMNDLSAITSWDAPDATTNPNASSTSTDLAAQFVKAGRDEVTVLDKVIAAKSPEEVLAIGDEVKNADNTFDTAYEAARTQIVGIEVSPSTQPTLALPSGSVGPCATPTPSISPDGSSSPGASSSPALTPGPTPSALPSGASSASPSVGPSLSPSPSVAPTPCLPVTPSPGDVLDNSGT